MSEEILKALTQLFAIITKQDGGVTETERNFVIGFFRQELDQDSVKEYLNLYDKYSGYSAQDRENEEVLTVKQTQTSVKDSIRTLGLTKKINKTLTQKQKVVVLIKILELVGSDQNFTPQRMEIVNTISTVFNISNKEYKLVENFNSTEDLSGLKSNNLLVVNANHNKIEEKKGGARHLYADIKGDLYFIRVSSVDMYFVRYIGTDEVMINGFIIQPKRVYLFSHGSSIKTPTGNALYHSDIVSIFSDDIQTARLSFDAVIDEYKFSNGTTGLINIKISEGPGRLVGIMGASGAGKTTLLNVLAGLDSPTKGVIKINGIDINKDREKIHGVIGYVSQDDMLIEDLTVYENLYYNAKLCFGHYTEEQLEKCVMDVLESLGLDQRRNLKVGNALDKMISGGQRKRLNIALELIREPAVMFVDEPTSGLSSRDSENVIDLLKELSLKGKLIFVVIHQPSSDIFKMFDKIFIMDTGGYPVYYGNPVESVIYFKTASNQVDKMRGQCETCGNVNPEQIFNIIESKVVDEYGQLTVKRKVNPQQWMGHYEKNFKIGKVPEVNDAPDVSLNIPGKLKQTWIFVARDVLSKISNRQYLLINLLEAPALAVILAFFIRYKNSPTGTEYIFRFNENIPAFLLMSIVVGLFMGLTVSAEEIIRDRKILKRESFLNLSWMSYLNSKIIILFTLSAIQTLSFVLIGNLILEIRDMLLPFWFMLFTVSCMANVMGLNISSALNSAVTVYVVIPLLLIPQMILSGLLFSFDKLNSVISTKGKVPVVADLMASRWAYEALTVYQFKNNRYQAPYYNYEKTEAMADFKSAYIYDELENSRRTIMINTGTATSEAKSNLSIIKNTLKNEPYRQGLEKINIDQLTLENFPEYNDLLQKYFENYREQYLRLYNESVVEKEQMMAFFQENPEYNYDLNTYKNLYFNESLADLVRNISVKKRILKHNGELIQQINPVFNDPVPRHLLDYRSHFFASKKHFLGFYLDTYYFNALVIWIMSVVLYIALYFEWLKKLIRVSFRRKQGKRK